MKDKNIPYIAYKVVGKNNRYGINAIIIKDFHFVKISDYLKSNPIMKPFFPKYNKEKIIISPDKSPGLCCFKRKTDAENFLKNELTNFKSKMKIISVLILESNENGTNVLLCGCGTNPRKILSYNKLKNDSFNVRETPRGTIFVKKLKVLE